MMKSNILLCVVLSMAGLDASPTGAVTNLNLLQPRDGHDSIMTSGGADRSLNGGLLKIFDEGDDDPADHSMILDTNDLDLNALLIGGDPHPAGPQFPTTGFNPTASDSVPLVSRPQAPTTMATAEPQNRFLAHARSKTDGDRPFSDFAASTSTMKQAENRAWFEQLQATDVFDKGADGEPFAKRAHKSHDPPSAAAQITITRPGSTGPRVPPQKSSLSLYEQIVEANKMGVATFGEGIPVVPAGMDAENDPTPLSMPASFEDTYLRQDSSTDFMATLKQADNAKLEQLRQAMSTTRPVVTAEYCTEDEDVLDRDVSKEELAFSRLYAGDIQAGLYVAASKCNLAPILDMKHMLSDSATVTEILIRFAANGCQDAFHYMSGHESFFNVARDKPLFYAQLSEVAALFGHSEMAQRIHNRSARSRSIANSFDAQKSLDTLSDDNRKQIVKGWCGDASFRKSQLTNLASQKLYLCSKYYFEYVSLKRVELKMIVEAAIDNVELLVTLLEQFDSIQDALTAIILGDPDGTLAQMTREKCTLANLNSKWSKYCPAAFHGLSLTSRDPDALLTRLQELFYHVSLQDSEAERLHAELAKLDALPRCVPYSQTITRMITIVSSRRYNAETVLGYANLAETAEEKQLALAVGQIFTQPENRELLAHQANIKGHQLQDADLKSAVELLRVKLRHDYARKTEELARSAQVAKFLLLNSAREPNGFAVLQIAYTEKSLEMFEFCLNTMHFKDQNGYLLQQAQNQVARLSLAQDTLSFQGKIVLDNLRTMVRLLASH